MKIEDLILEVIKKGVFIDSVTIVEDLDVLGYSIRGFSKSGTVTLFESNGKIFASARYNETTEISNFDDLVSLAWDWYVRYKDRSPFESPDSNWVDHFIERGWLKMVRDYKIVYKNIK